MSFRNRGEPWKMSAEMAAEENELMGELSPGTRMFDAASGREVGVPTPPSQSYWANMGGQQAQIITADMLERLRSLAGIRATAGIGISPDDLAAVNSQGQIVNAQQSYADTKRRAERAARADEAQRQYVPIKIPTYEASPLQGIRVRQSEWVGNWDEPAVVQSNGQREEIIDAVYPPKKPVDSWDEPARRKIR